jgi:hypothetical protein
LSANTLKSQEKMMYISREKFTNPYSAVVPYKKKSKIIYKVLLASLSFTFREYFCGKIALG